MRPPGSIALASPGGARVDAFSLRQTDNHILHEIHDDNGWHLPADDFGAITTNGKLSAVASSTTRFHG